MPTRFPPTTAASAPSPGDLKAEIADATGGLRASVGIGSSKLVAKIASDLEKPDGLVVVRPGAEEALLRPMPVTAIPGIGPATNAKLLRVGVRTIADLQRIGVGELVALVGRAHGETLSRLAHALDDRAVEPDRETKSISVEDTFDVDLVDPVVLGGIVTRHARQVCDRLRAARLFGRTVTVKVRMHDFATHTRSTTLPAPTDRPRLVADLAAALLAEVDTSTGVRLLGVGVSGLTDWVQDDLFAEQEDAEPPERAPVVADGTDVPTARRGRVMWPPGADVEHRAYGPGWVWGSGLGRVTVRFETAQTGPGAVRTFAVDDPDLSRRGPGSPADRPEGAPSPGGLRGSDEGRHPPSTVGGVQIRERTADDLSACVTALRSVYETDGYPANWPEDPERWISAPGRTTQAWVASVDDEIAGHLAVAVGLTDDAWRDHTDRAPAELIEIIRLFVAPKHRGKGVGGRLMAEAQEYADSRGLQPVLEVADDESAAIGLYESLGWQLVDTRPATWTTPDGVHPTLRWYVARSSLIAF